MEKLLGKIIMKIKKLPNVFGNFKTPELLRVFCY